MSGQIKCGTLEQLADKSFEGRIALIGRFDGSLSLVPVEKRGNAGKDAPQYDAYFTHRSGGTKFHVGAAWLKQGHHVAEFLSITMSHPSWTSDMNLQAFPPDKSKEPWRVVWSRPRGERVQDEKEFA